MLTKMKLDSRRVQQPEVWSLDTQSETCSFREPDPFQFTALLTLLVMTFPFDPNVQRLYRITASGCCKKYLCYKVLQGLVHASVGSFGNTKIFEGWDGCYSCGWLHSGAGMLWALQALGTMRLCRNKAWQLPQLCLRRRNLMPFCGWWYWLEHEEDYICTAQNYVPSTGINLVT